MLLSGLRLGAGSGQRPASHFHECPICFAQPWEKNGLSDNLLRPIVNWIPVGISWRNRLVSNLLILRTEAPRSHCCSLRESKAKLPPIGLPPRPSRNNAGQSKLRKKQQHASPVLFLKNVSPAPQKAKFPFIHTTANCAVICCHLLLLCERQKGKRTFRHTETFGLFFFLAFFWVS